jgi:hypothetical protein
MTRTTVRLPDKVMRDAKRLAAETGRTLTAVIEDALREAIARRRQPAAPRKVKLTTVGGRGIAPGVSLDDSVALRELMDQDASP